MSDPITPSTAPTHALDLPSEPYVAQGHHSESDHSMDKEKNEELGDNVLSHEVAEDSALVRFPLAPFLITDTLAANKTFFFLFLSLIVSAMLG